MPLAHDASQARSALLLDERFSFARRGTEVEGKSFVFDTRGFAFCVRFSPRVAHDAYRHLWRYGPPQIPFSLRH